MKKIWFTIILLSLGSLLPAAGDKLFASLGAAVLLPGDSRFADIYGTAQFGPELRVGFNMYKNFYFWLGGCYFPAKGTIPVLEDEARATQSLLSLGAGWETRRTRRLQADLFAALLLAGFREKAMGTTASKMAAGFEVGTGLRYFLQKKLFLGMAVGYAGAWTSVRSGGAEKDIILGGVRVSGRLGIRF